MGDPLREKLGRCCAAGGGVFKRTHSRCLLHELTDRVCKLMSFLARMVSTDEMLRARFFNLMVFHSKGRCKAAWKRELKLPWREAGPPNHLDDEVDSDQ